MFCTGCGRPVGVQPPPQAYYPPPPQAYYPPPPEPEVRSICSVFEIFNRVQAVLRTKPLLLWGISLMFNLLVVVTFFLILLPIIYLPVVATLQIGMTSVFLAGYRGKQIGTAMLFGGFNDFKRVAGGMLWMWLWLLIWAMIPLVGLVMVVIKGFAYIFVPYILLTKPEVSATEALKQSVEMTRGYKGKMFCAYVLIYIIVAVVFLVLYLLGLIPFVGIVFLIISVIFTILCVAFLPLFVGLVGVAFFDEIEGVNNR